MPKPSLELLERSFDAIGIELVEQGNELVITSPKQAVLSAITAILRNTDGLAFSVSYEKGIKITAIRVTLTNHDEEVAKIESTLTLSEADIQTKGILAGRDRTRDGIIKVVQYLGLEHCTNIAYRDQKMASWLHIYQGSAVTDYDYMKMYLRDNSVKFHQGWERGRPCLLIDEEDLTG